jgi:hypothetical protein
MNQASNFGATARLRTRQAALRGSPPTPTFSDSIRMSIRSRSGTEP